MAPALCKVCFVFFLACLFLLLAVLQWLLWPDSEAYVLRVGITPVPPGCPCVSRISDLVILWLLCQMCGGLWSVLGLVGLLSVYCYLVRWQV